MIKFDEFLKLVPDHFTKEDTMKFLNCLKPCFEYIDELLTEMIGMKSIEKAHDEYLDYLGYYESINRSDRSTKDKYLKYDTRKNISSFPLNGVIIKQKIENVTISSPDEIFRPFLFTKRFIRNNAPTTKNLIELTKKTTGFYPVSLEFYPNGELASHTIKYVVPHTTNLDNFPNLNEICDAGARIYQSILLDGDQRNYRSSFVLNKDVLQDNVKKIEIKP